MSALLEILNLVKKYKTLTAVDDISFSIPQGVCFGLLGPNGAGKTTTIEILEDVISPTSGKVLYKGQPRSFAFREEVGIQFQKTELLSWLTIEETLKTFQSLYRTSCTVEEVLELCQLKEIRKQYNDKVSGGQRQRLFLALALINDPDLLFLDEPSTGLDPQARHNLWDIIIKIREKGKTVVLTTHYMEEAQQLCDDIAIMDHGKLIARGTPNELIDVHCADCVTDGLRSPNLEDVFIRLTGRGLRE